MSADFQFDVFLSHSAKDKPVVRPLAERLRGDGLRVWFDEWMLKPGDSIPAKIEEGLEHSRVLVLCMSAKAFGSDWAQLESQTFRFRDPLNQERRFIPLRLDDAPNKGSLAQFLYINWRHTDREQEYAMLLEACRAPKARQHALHLIPATNEVVQTFADLLAVIAAAADDNKITPEESRQIRRSWEGLKSLTENFVACCEEGGFLPAKKKPTEIGKRR